jgi:hypothetical protein
MVRMLANGDTVDGWPSIRRLRARTFGHVSNTPPIWLRNRSRRSKLPHLWTAALAGSRFRPGASRSPVQPHATSSLIVRLRQPNRVRIHQAVMARHRAFSGSGMAGPSCCCARLDTQRVPIKVAQWRNCECWVQWCGSHNLGPDPSDAGRNFWPAGSPGNEGSGRRTSTALSGRNHAPTRPIANRPQDAILPYMANRNAYRLKPVLPMFWQRTVRWRISPYT